MSGSGTEPVYPTVDLHTARSVCPPVLPFLLLCAPLNCSAHCSKAWETLADYRQITARRRCPQALPGLCVLRYEI